MSSCLKGRGGADFRGEGSDLGRTRPLQLGGHCVIETFWETQSTSGLWRVSQECPIVRACLRLGMYYILVLMELQWICGTGAQGDGSLLNALSRKCYMRTLQYVHRGTLPWAENEKKAVFSFCPSPTIYNKWVTWRAGAKQARCGYPLSPMKMHQANAAYGEKDK